MGSKKNKLAEKIKEGDRIGDEAKERGEELQQDGSEIKNLINSIDTSLDEDDVAAVQNAETVYGRDFDGAFKSEVDTKAAESESTEKNATDETQQEIGKVTHAADTFKEMMGVTDVGNSTAGNAIDGLKKSNAEYEEYVAESDRIIESVRSDVETLRGAIDSLFG